MRNYETYYKCDKFIMGLNISGIISTPQEKLDKKNIISYYYPPYNSKLPQSASVL